MKWLKELSVACWMLSIALNPQPAEPAPAAAHSELSAVAFPGLRLDDRPVTYEQMGRYLEMLAGKSERIRLSVYGTTSLGKQLRVATISAPANLARLEEIDREVARLASGDVSEPEASSIARSLPAVAWMGYGIHSDELSASDAGLRLIERLVIGHDAQTQSILEKLVVYVDPMANPDGRERFLARVDSFRRQTPNVDSQDIIQTPPWPPGRLNHYLMDLNRDALFITQPESAARVTAIIRAHPQLFVDAHEMVYLSTHLFALPGEPLNPYLPPPIRRSWDRFGADIAGSYDNSGKSYYSRSWDEVFYPGYYDILPAYSGITPLLFEQARSSGVSVELPNGRVRTYAEAVANHLQSAWTTLSSAADHRAELLDDWRTARQRAARSIERGEPKVWFVIPDNAYKLAQLIRILRVHQVTYYRMSSSMSVGNLRSAWSEVPESRLLPAGTLVVPTNQVAAGLVRNIFDFHVPMDEKFLAAERERIDLGRKSQIYDITAWSVPLAFDLTAYWSTSMPAGNWQRSESTQLASPPEHPVTAVEPQPARYGYIYEDPSLFATARLLQAGVKIRIATEPFEQQGQSYQRGTFLVRNDDQSLPARAKLVDEAAKSNTVFRSTDSARAQSGPDLGDDKFVLLTAPNIGLVAGRWTQAMNVGAMWQMFDQGIGFPVTLLDIDSLDSSDLSRYNVLLLPDAEDYEKLGAVLASSVDALKGWVRAGGTLVVQGGGLLAAVHAGLTAVVPRTAASDPTLTVMLGRSAAEIIRSDFTAAEGVTFTSIPESPKWTEETAPVISEAAQAVLGRRARAYVFPKILPSAAQWAGETGRSDRLLHALPMIAKSYLPHGAYLRVDLKPMHWLGYGANDRIPVLFREQDALLARRPVEVIGRYGEPRKLALAGLIWPEAVGYIAESAYLTREKQGRGQVIAFANDAAYRGYSLGTQRILLNAAILGPGMRSE